MVRESFQDYYSIFNKKGGWLNLTFLMPSPRSVSLSLAAAEFTGRLPSSSSPSSASSSTSSSSSEP